MFGFLAFGRKNDFWNRKQGFKQLLLYTLVLQNIEHSICGARNLERVLIFRPFLFKKEMTVCALLYHAVHLIQLLFEILV